MKADAAEAHQERHDKDPARHPQRPTQGTRSRRNGKEPGYECNVNPRPPSPFDKAERDLKAQCKSSLLELYRLPRRTIPSEVELHQLQA